MSSFFEFSNYLFILAHPDDEIYTCVFIKKLVDVGKTVDILYVTSGDYEGSEMGQIREREVLDSMKLLGISNSHTHFLRVPERRLMDVVPKVLADILEKTKLLKINCVVSHDFEGGHNGHDIVSFCASQITRDLAATLYVFPAYYAWPERRKWNQFVPPREASEVLMLAPGQKELQRQVIVAHTTQARFFDMVRKSDSYNLFSTREVLRLVPAKVDYTKPPTNPVGYEYPNSNLSFDDFREAIEGCDKIEL